MKYVSGTLIITLLLAIAAYVLARVWGVDLLDRAYAAKLLPSAGIIVCTALVLTILIPFFFRKNNKGYDASRGNKAHPRA